MLLSWRGTVALSLSLSLRLLLPLMTFKVGWDLCLMSGSPATKAWYCWVSPRRRRIRWLDGLRPEVWFELGYAGDRGIWISSELGFGFLPPLPFVLWIWIWNSGLCIWFGIWRERERWVWQMVLLSYYGGWGWTVPEMVAVKYSLEVDEGLCGCFFVLF